MKTYQKVIAAAPPLESKAYGEYYTLTADVSAECWNHTDGAITVLPRGLHIKVEYPGSDCTTVVKVGGQSPEGITCSNGRQGWKFIVDNVKLSESIACYIPAKTYDLVGAIMEAES